MKELNLELLELKVLKELNKDGYVDVYNNGEFIVIFKEGEGDEFDDTDFSYFTMKDFIRELSDGFTE